MAKANSSFSEVQIARRIKEGRGWILTNKKRPAATERSEQIQMEF